MSIKQKGVEILQLLNVHNNVIMDYKNNNKLNKSEAPLGLLYWLTEEEQELVDNFEKENPECFVYHVLRTVTADFGVVYDLLYLTEDDEDLKKAKEDLKEDLLLSYTVTEFPESGLISIKNVNGGIVRNY